MHNAPYWKTTASTQIGLLLPSFYQALHWVDAFLLTKEYEPNNHGQRRDYIGQTEELKEIKNNYLKLKNASQMARYDETTFKDAPAEVQELLEISSSIINHIKTLMNIG